MLMGERPSVVLFTNSIVMGGLEEHVLQLGRGLVERGYQVAAICAPAPGIQPLRQQLAEAGIQIHPVAPRNGPGGAVRRLAALVETFRSYPRGVLHYHSTGFAGGELVFLAARLAGIRAIVRTEHVPPRPPVDWGTKVAVGLRDRALARVICVSEQNRREHMQLLGRSAQKVTVIPNGVDLTRFVPQVADQSVASEFGLDPSRPLVGTVSRLSERRKGIHCFLEMAAAVSRDFPNAAFLIVGDGPLRPALEQQATDLGISNQVLFAGERSDIPRLLAGMTVFVMPSLYEGGPYTVLEALALSRPVVSTPVGLVPDVLTDQVNGLIAPIGDSAGLATAVLRLLADPEWATALGQQGRAAVENGFSLTDMIEQTARIYDEIAA